MRRHARPRDVDRRLYGPAAYGTIGAAGPVTAAAYSAVVGYTALMWTLAALALAAAGLALAVRPATRAPRDGGAASPPQADAAN